MGDIMRRTAWQQENQKKQVCFDIYNNISYSANLDDLGVAEATVAGYVTLLKK